MAMNSLISPNFSRIIVSVLALLFLLSSSSCLDHNPPPGAFMDLVVAEKTRLGSTPPSCHNKCNQCHPCMAVQVPTLPSHNRFEPEEKPLDYFGASPGNRYSNYKPLGWKCRCNGHFYNP